MSTGIYQDGQHDLLRQEDRFRRLSRVRWINKFGRNPDIPNVSNQTIWYEGGTYLFPAPPGGFSGTLVSTVINDDNLTGSGAWTVNVQGLDSNFNEIEEDVDLDGTTSVNLANQYSRINRMQVTSGFDNSVNSNIGVLTCELGGSFTAATIGAARGQTEQAIYTVPNNMRAYMTQYYMSMNKRTNASADMSLKTRSLSDGDGGIGPNGAILTKHTQGIRGDGTSYIRHKFDPEFVIDGPCDVWMTCESSTSTDLDISAGFDLYLVDK